MIATREEIAQARQEAIEMGRLNNSIRQGQGNYVGFLGEIVVANAYGWKRENTFDYDVIAPDGRKVDVKTKERNVPCLGEYWASVADFNTKQECDVYLFVSVYGGNNVEIMGWLGKKEFYEKARFFKKDEVDPNSSQGWKFRADCYNVLYSELRGVEEE